MSDVEMHTYAFLNIPHPLYRFKIFFSYIYEHFKRMALGQLKDNQ